MSARTSDLTVAQLIEPYVRLLRPHHWTKNAVVLAGVVFSGRAGDPTYLIRAALALVAFCLCSSAVYVFNDWHDRAEDRLHPTKRRRPIALGQVSTPGALALAGGMAAVALMLGVSIRPLVAGVLAAYLGLMVLYTLFLRRLPIFDILAIAIGFVLRAVAGAATVSVPLSVWLFVCTMLLALLLGLGKRRHELRMLHGETSHHRPSLVGYGQLQLDKVMLAVTALTFSAYLAYTLVVPSYGRSLPMALTVPFVALALARYLYLVFRRNLGGSPEWLLVRDRPLFASIVAWALAVGAVLIS
jgi:4-hydroxybenzoate polyprenyltransferase